MFSRSSTIVYWFMIFYCKINTIFNSFKMIISFYYFVKYSIFLPYSNFYIYIVTNTFFLYYLGLHGGRQHVLCLVLLLLFKQSSLILKLFSTSPSISCCWHLCYSTINCIPDRIACPNLPTSWQALDCGWLLRFWTQWWYFPLVMGFNVSLYAFFMHLSFECSNATDEWGGRECLWEQISGKCWSPMGSEFFYHTIRPGSYIK